jgi:hypothetical protein
MSWDEPTAVNHTFSGVGGMLGVRRGVDVPKLQAAARLGALDDILFPRDPVADAPRLINEFRTIFPYTVGAFTIGAFLELGYLKPQVAKLRVGVIVESNRVDPGSSDLDPVRILILGQVIIDIPIKKKTSAIKIIFDIVGIIDLQAKSVIFGARLRDSKVLSFTLTGMVVLRKDYGEKKLFVLAAGGFHPDLQGVPTGLPAPIDRLGFQRRSSSAASSSRSPATSRSRPTPCSSAWPESSRGSSGRCRRKRRW